MHYTPDIRTFVRIMVLFWLPVFVLFGVTVFFSVYSGEITPLGYVIERQVRNDREYLFARGVIGRETARYKYMGAERASPSILVVGSSRVLELRAEMFGGTGSFYNAGSMVGSVHDLVDFIDTLPVGREPEVVILGIDAWWFDASRFNKRGLREALSKGEEFYNWKAYVYSGRRIISQILKNPAYISDSMIGIDPFDGRRAIGLDALEHGNGFRNDGSRQYAGYLTAMRQDMRYVDREDPPIIERLEEGLDPFSYASEFDDEGLKILAEFLSKSKERGITVIGFAPAFSSEVYEEMMDSYYTEFFSAFQERVPGVFGEYGFAYFDFSDVRSLGLEDVYMFDGFHLTETGTAAMFAQMINTTCEGVFTGCEHMREILDAALKDPLTTPAEVNWQAF